MSIAIKVENLSKAYRIGEIGTGTMYQDLQRWWAKQRGHEDPFLKIGEANDREVKGTSDVVWSLKDINFEIEQGDAVGIIGRNGAGKSTLLKILSRITSPTSGNISGQGRIASLLEVGTGFHPELTGRENIYLNGAILGMRKKEITRHFDAIVDFSGVERYIDTPVKRYSSGMYVRLAFAVAAHLESEILIVDEVLAVGDAEFQKKCLGKMGKVSKGEGRTVLFVSHNMAAMQKLCNKGMLLQNGQLIEMGPMKKVADTYLIHGFSNANAKDFEIDETKLASVFRVELTDEEGKAIYEAPIGRKWMVKVYFKVIKEVENFISAIGITSPLEISINTSWQEPRLLQPGTYCAQFCQSEVQYATGKYRVSIGLSIGGLQVIQYIEDVIDLNIVPIIEEVDELVVKYDAITSAILNPLLMNTYKIENCCSEC